MELRQFALYVSRVRVGLGITMMVSPRVAFGPFYGREVTDPAATAITRMMGARDAALGAGAAIAVGERTGAENWISMLAVVDGLDAIVNLASPRIGWRGKLLGVLGAVSCVGHITLAKRLRANLETE